MLIRPAREEDASAIADFTVMAEGEVLRYLFGVENAEEAKEALRKVIVAPVPSRYSLAHCLVAEIRGKAVASLFFFPADSQPTLDAPLVEGLNKRGVKVDKLFFEGVPGTYYISTLGVDPAYRGRGLGSALLKAAAEKARDAGYAQTSLLVSQGKKRARGLYEKKGYRVVEEAAMVSERYYRMAKDLLPESPSS